MAVDGIERGCYQKDYGLLIRRSGRFYEIEGIYDRTTRTRSAEAWADLKTVLHFVYD
ncbi:MAG: hypothetical protein JWO80_3670 [Bryobacterales bacterium]|nr:hypothetical protein [Bryobacterales bacterium]